MTGSVGHSDVIGYTSGRVMILSELQWDLDNTKSIFKMGQKHWDCIINKSSNRSSVYTERFLLFRNAEGFLRVLITNLKLEDTGTYRIAVGNHNRYNVNLDVRKGEKMSIFILLLKRNESHINHNYNVTSLCNWQILVTENQEQWPLTEGKISASSVTIL